MKSINLIVLLALVLTVVFACHEDSKPVVSFDSNDYNTMSEGTLQNIVDSYGPTLVLSEPASSDIFVNISVTGGNAVYGDDFTYSKPVLIRKGEKVGSIGLQIVNDNVEEYDDTLQLTISSVNGDKAMINSKPTHFIIKNDDVSDLKISVHWVTTTSSRVDLYLWRETSPGSNSFKILQESNGSDETAGSASLTLLGVEKDGLYGLSFAYHSGLADPLDLAITMESVGPSILEGSFSYLIFSARYSQSNISTGSAPIIEQYFTKQGIEFKNFTPIAVPKSGS